MSRLRLHAASWCSLAAVSLLLLIVNLDLDYRWNGYPTVFWTDHLVVSALTLDVCFWVFLSLGTVAAIELWCRTNGPPRVSLLALFGAMSGICFYFYRSSGPSPRVDLLLALFYRVAVIGHHLIPAVFGVAVVGWVKLVALAFKRRS